MSVDDAAQDIFEMECRIKTGQSDWATAALIELPSAEHSSGCVRSMDKQNPLASAIGAMRVDIAPMFLTRSETVSNRASFEILSDFWLSISHCSDQLHYATVCGSIAEPQT